MNPLLYALIGSVAGAGIVALIFLFARRRGGGESELARRLEIFDRAQEREEKMFRDEFSRMREEAAGSGKAQREELAGALKNVSDTTLKS
ncbi:MAG: hypothetical protein QOE34_68, partial [Verrucomicrobiota bacterium]